MIIADVTMHKMVCSNKIQLIPKKPKKNTCCPTKFVIDGRSFSFVGLINSLMPSGAYMNNCYIIVHCAIRKKILFQILTEM